MAAGFQNTATTTVATALAGDYIGAPFYPTLAGTVSGSAGVKCGTFCWLVKDSQNKVVQAKGSNVLLAGLVLRANENSWADGSFPDGFSLTIPQYQMADIAKQGSFKVPLVAVLGSDPIPQGAAVYVRNTDGAIIAGVTVETGYTKTNYIFMSAQADIVAAQDVIISNVFKIEGA
jgi:hypothetical protein